MAIAMFGGKIERVAIHRQALGRDRGISTSSFSGISAIASRLTGPKQAERLRRGSRMESAYPPNRLINYSEVGSGRGYFGQSDFLKLNAAEIVLSNS